MLQASVTSLARAKCSRSLTSEIFLPTVSGLKYTHPSVTLLCFSSLSLEKTRWAEPRPCNLRLDFHWKQMLSIRRKDQLMFSKAYDNKPRGLSHASWRNRAKRLHQLPAQTMSEWVSEQDEVWNHEKHWRREGRRDEETRERKNWKRGGRGSTGLLMQVWMLRGCVAGPLFDQKASS